jgi:hypothetical protein
LEQAVTGSGIGGGFGQHRLGEACTGVGAQQKLQVVSSTIRMPSMDSTIQS